MSNGVVHNVTSGEGGAGPSSHAPETATHVSDGPTPAHPPQASTSTEEPLPPGWEMRYDVYGRR